ncbi:MAG: pyridoxamine 5'-phosphate oxidase family protein [Spirochaetes bacterium]|nr:pyridoxamine 5'-phosphate oxidase family protein [Spirochaetota bacterium]
MKKFKKFETQDMKEFEPDAKIGLIATINPEGLPHLTLITALQAKTPTLLTWGQFSEGFSKKNVKTNPNTAFMIMSLKRDLWRGKAVWTHEEKEGEDYEMYNRKPMFRYNTYFGIHTVHFMNLKETYGREKLPMSAIVRGAVITKCTKGLAKSRRESTILKPWAMNLFNRLDSLKFLAYIGTDGFPEIIPVIQCQAADTGRLAFAPTAYLNELKQIKEGTKIAVFGMTLQMEDVLTRGTFTGFRRFPGMKLGIIDIDWVYNSMPPVQGQIYPPGGTKPVTDWSVPV